MKNNTASHNCKVTAIDSLNIFTYTFLLLNEENPSISRKFLQRLDVCCSWCLQQRGKAVSRNSDAFVTDQSQSEPRAQNPGPNQGPQHKGRSKRSISVVLIGCEAAWAWAGALLAAQLKLNDACLWALHISVCLTAPCSSYRGAGEQGKERERWVMFLLSKDTGWEVKTCSLFSCRQTKGMMLLMSPPHLMRKYRKCDIRP